MIILTDGARVWPVGDSSVFGCWTTVTALVVVVVAVAAAAAVAVDAAARCK